MKAIGPAELLHAFDGVDKYAKIFGQTLGHLADVFARTGVSDKFQALGATIANIFNQRFLGGFNPDNLFKQITNPATGNIETAMTAQGDAFMKKFDRLADVAGTIADRLTALSNAINGVVTPFQKLGSLFSVIDNFTWGKAAPFLWQKSGDAFNMIGDKVTHLFQGDQATNSNDVQQRAQEIKDKFEQSGKSAQDIQAKLARLPGIGQQFTGQLSMGFNQLAAKMAGIVNGLSVADQTIRSLQGAQSAKPLSPPATIAKPSSSPAPTGSPTSSINNGSESKSVATVNQTINIHGNVLDHCSFVDKVWQATQEILRRDNMSAYA